MSLGIGVELNGILQDAAATRCTLSDRDGVCIRRSLYICYVLSNDARGVTVGIVRTDSTQCAVHLRWHEVQAAVQVVNADSTRLCIGAANAIQRLHLHLVQGMQNLLRLLA